MTESSQHESVSLFDRKHALRRLARDARNNQPDQDALSRLAMEQLLAMPACESATTAMWYVDCGSELRTRTALPVAIASGQRIVVPFCTMDDEGDKQLGLWRINDLAELVVGKWKILEPPKDRWDDGDRKITPGELDVVIVPGLAFSREGARLGNGQGYYDRLLANVRADCALVGVCYESQLFEGLAVAAHDVFMDYVITERQIYLGQRQHRRG